MKAKWMVAGVLSVVSLAMLTGCGGPSNSFVKDAVKEKRGMDYNTSAPLVDCKIDNNYTRKVDDETYYIYEVTAHYFRNKTDAEIEKEKEIAREIISRKIKSNRESIERSNNASGGHKSEYSKNLDAEMEAEADALENKLKKGDARPNPSDSFDKEISLKASFVKRGKEWYFSVE